VIAKVTQGASGAALLRYLFGPGRANEHSNQRVVTSGIVMGVDEGRALTPLEIADLGAALDGANDIYGSHPAGGHIWHLSLSLPAGESLTDEQWAESAQRTVEAIGFEQEGVEPAAWVVVGHGNGAHGNQHIHLAASLVRVDGSRVDTWQSKRTLSKLCAELETAYGLTVVEGRHGKGMPGLSRAELERTAREQLAEPPRVTLARMAREASVASRDEAEFVRRLRGSGVLLRPRFKTGGIEAVVGYSVALRVVDGDMPIWFGGGKLAKDLTLPNLRQFWELSAGARKSAVIEWSAAKAVAPGRESILGIPDDWRRAATAIERDVEKLRAFPVSDLAAWRGASREAAGLFAAWSRRFEGDSPGPMAQAAEALARSAQSRPDDPVPKRDAVANFRGVAAIVAQSRLGHDSPMAWAKLIDQLGRTLRILSDAHVARGETEAAKLLVHDLSRELQLLHDRFKTSFARELLPNERAPDYLRDPLKSYGIGGHHVAHHRGRGSSQGRGFGR
jgi:hypothetical protein